MHGLHPLNSTRHRDQWEELTEYVPECAGLNNYNRIQYITKFILTCFLEIIL
jgi:hypothetical protein